MKVKELAELLATCPPEAEIFVVDDEYAPRPIFYLDRLTRPEDPDFGVTKIHVVIC